jgi:hypothetical protein
MALADAGLVADALEFGLEGVLVAGVGDIEEEIRVVGLQELGGRHGGADAEDAGGPISTGLAPGQRRPHRRNMNLHLSASCHFAQTFEMRALPTLFAAYCKFDQYSKLVTSKLCTTYLLGHTFKMRNRVRTEYRNLRVEKNVINWRKEICRSDWIGLRWLLNQILGRMLAE